MRTNHARLFLILLLPAALCACSRKPAAGIDDVIKYFKDAGMTVAEPDYGPLTGQIKEAEQGMSMAAGFGPNRPVIRTMEINGVLTMIHCFKNESEADNFVQAAQNMPSLDAKMPARFKEVLGTPVYVQHKNIVLRMDEKSGDHGNSAAIAEIKEKFSAL